MHVVFLTSLVALAQGRAHHNHHHQQQSHGNGTGHAYGHAAGHQTHIHPSIQLGPAPYIVGGEDVTRSQFPFIVSLQNAGGHFCGGSLIASNLVLTAAHCCISSTITVAASNGRQDVDSPRVTARRRQCKRHPDYDSRTLENDIAVIVLPQELRGNDQYPVEYARLPSNPAVDNELCEVTGWGTLSMGGQLAQVLQSVRIPIVSQEQCEESYYSYDIYDTMMCAGYLRGGIDSCQGDSGGPLTCNNILQGIVSWGVGCALPNYPSVYTRVQSYMSWIGQQMARYGRK